MISLVVAAANVCNFPPEWQGRLKSKTTELVWEASRNKSVDQEAKSYVFEQPNRGGVDGGVRPHKFNYNCLNLPAQWVMV